MPAAPESSRGFQRYLAEAVVKQVIGISGFMVNDPVNEYLHWDKKILTRFALEVTTRSLRNNSRPCGSKREKNDELQSIFIIGMF